MRVHYESWPCVWVLRYHWKDLKHASWVGSSIASFDLNPRYESGFTFIGRSGYFCQDKFVSAVWCGRAWTILWLFQALLRWICQFLVVQRTLYQSRGNGSKTWNRSIPSMLPQARSVSNSQISSGWGSYRLRPLHNEHVYILHCWAGPLLSQLKMDIWVLPFLMGLSGGYYCSFLTFLRARVSLLVTWM